MKKKRTKTKQTLKFLQLWYKAIKVSYVAISACATAWHSSIFPLQMNSEWDLRSPKMASRIMSRMSSLIRGSQQSLRFMSATSIPDVPVMSWNEWDPLEEIIVGRAEGQRIPFLHPDFKVNPFSSEILFLYTENFVTVWNIFSLALLSQGSQL